jgi:hypothetical protein
LECRVAGLFADLPQLVISQMPRASMSRQSFVDVEVVFARQATESVNDRQAVGLASGNVVTGGEFTWASPNRPRVRRGPSWQAAEMAASSEGPGFVAR